MDSDNDVDILATARTADDIAWYENDGNENFTKHIITDDYDWPTFVCGCDIDDDNDMDIVSAAYYAGDISWWANDGSENFTKQTISASFGGAIPVTAIDVDDDDDIDVIAAAYDLGDITWWENDLTAVDEGSTGYLPIQNRGASILTSIRQLDYLSSYTIYDATGRVADREALHAGTYFIETSGEIAYKVVVVR